MRHVHVLRSTVAVLARPVLRQAFALSVGLGVPAAILFSGNGLRASDVVAFQHRSSVARLLLWGGWLVLGGPALRTVFEAPGSRTLRALRLPRALLLTALFVLSSTAQLPVVLLFVRGAGLLAGWTALALAVALGAGVFAALRRPRWTPLVALCATLVLWDPPPLVAAVSASLLVPLALHAAFRCALEQSHFHVRLTRPTHPMLALYVVHLLRLWRAARARLVLALGVGAAGGAWLWLSLQHDASDQPLRRALSALALPLTVAAALCVAPVLESEALLYRVLRSLRTNKHFALGAFLLAVATPSSAMAATSGFFASSAGEHSAGATAAVLVAWALGLSSAVALWGRLLERRGRRSAGAFAAGVALLASVALASVSPW